MKVHTISEKTSLLNSPLKANPSLVVAISRLRIATSSLEMAVFKLEIAMFDKPNAPRPRALVGWWHHCGRQGLLQGLAKPWNCDFETLK